MCDFNPFDLNRDGVVDGADAFLYHELFEDDEEDFDIDYLDDDNEEDEDDIDFDYYDELDDEDEDEDDW